MYKQENKNIYIDIRWRWNNTKSKRIRSEFQKIWKSVARPTMLYALGSRHDGYIRDGTEPVRAFRGRDIDWSGHTDRWDWSLAYKHPRQHPPV